MLVNVHVLHVNVYVCVRTCKVNGITRVQREIVEASPQGRAASESAGQTTVQVSSDSESTERSQL